MRFANRRRGEAKLLREEDRRLSAARRHHRREAFGHHPPLVFGRPKPTLTRALQLRRLIRLIPLHR
jgi:hypothetical protein